MNEEDRIILDPRRMFPEAVKRVEILEKLKQIWKTVVRYQAVADVSSPSVLGVNYLIVELSGDKVRCDNARGKLSNMKGNILHRLEGFGYKPDGVFTLRINERANEKRTASGKRTASNKSVRREIIADDEKVKQYMTNAPDTLPEDINYALSHLAAYIEGSQRN